MRKKDIQRTLDREIKWQGRLSEAQALLDDEEKHKKPVDNNDKTSNLRLARSKSASR